MSMQNDEVAFPPEWMRDFLLEHKYLSAVKRVARGVSHTYNNIFTGLGGQFSMLLQEHALPAEPSAKRGELIRELLQRGIDQTAVLYGFVRGMEVGNHGHSPLLLANKALELLNVISRVHRFQLNAEVCHEKVACNALDIILLLFYLGENSVDVMPEGGTVELEIRREADDDSGKPSIAFRFRDKGPGFDLGRRDIPFCRPFVSDKKESPFSGLGLYCADILCRRNDGRLTVVNGRDRGAEVSVVFPAIHDHRAVEFAKTPEKKRPPLDGRHLVKQCFLVIDDDEAMRRLLLNRLQRRGHMVFCVDSCAEALEEYAQLHDIITVVLLDVGLDDVSGYECCKRILNINPQVRVVFMSGQEVVLPDWVPTASVFLMKPFSFDQLERAVCDVHV